MNKFGPILYAEDEDNDVFFMERAFAKLQVPHRLRTVPDGNLAIAYLAGTGPYADRTAYPLPCLILLDLSMPGKKGLDVLQWIRAQPHAAAVPVIVLTSSNQESDIHQAYLLGASGFLIKPGDPDELLQMVRGIQKFFLSEDPPPVPFLDIASVKPVP
jgi:CheY-like chemotaxis protein